MMTICVSQQALFFINYILLGCLASFPSELSRFSGFIVTYLKLKYLAKTDNEIGNVVDPDSIDFPDQYAQHLLIFVITISYSAIAPIILLFGSFYFLFAYVTWKHQVMCELRFDPGFAMYLVRDSDRWASLAFPFTVLAHD
mgnify:CR=1 FL=1